jgi:hypothetical protein
MRQPFVDDLPYETAFALLPDEDLESVDSRETDSIYWYRCGCAVIRFMDFEECRVRWCERHRPRGRPRILHSV